MSRRYFDSGKEDKDNKDFMDIRKREQERWEKEFYEKLRGDKRKSSWRIVFIIIIGIILYLLL